MSSKEVVLVTGANTGIGYLTAKAIGASSPNYHVIIGSRSIEKGQAALSDLQKGPGSFSLVQLDITNKSSIDGALATVTKDFNRLDVLINNAGAIVWGEWADALRESLEINCIGAAFVTEAFLPLLRVAPNPRLIFVSSGLGSLTLKANPTNLFRALPGQSYRIAKSALNMMALNYHVHEEKIKTFIFDPGYVVTDLSRKGEAGLEERRKNGAGDPKESADGILVLIEGKRDNERGTFVNKDGTFPW